MPKAPTKFTLECACGFSGKVEAIAELLACPECEAEQDAPKRQTRKPKPEEVDGFRIGDKVVLAIGGVELPGGTYSTHGEILDFRVWRPYRHDYQPWVRWSDGKEDFSLTSYLKKEKLQIQDYYPIPNLEQLTFKQFLDAVIAQSDTACGNAVSVDHFSRDGNTEYCYPKSFEVNGSIYRWNVSQRKTKGRGMSSHYELWSHGGKLGDRRICTLGNFGLKKGHLHKLLKLIYEIEFGIKPSSPSDSKKQSPSSAQPEYAGLDEEVRETSSRTSYPKRLIIVACSQRKTKAKRGAAHEIYDGPLHQLIAKALREDYFPPRTDILILSARYGLIRRCDWIETYEQRMTAARAQELRPQVEYALASVAVQGYNLTRDLITWTASKPSAPFVSVEAELYSEIYVELGQTYAQAIEGLLPKYFPDVTISYGEGGIGQRQSRLKQWLIERSKRSISLGSRVRVLTGIYQGRTAEVVAENLDTGKRVVEFEPPYDYDPREEYWEDELELLDSRSSYCTPGTRQTWRDLKEWFHIVSYHFEAKPDGSHRVNPDTIGAGWHVKELLSTELVEQCGDRTLLETISSFFNSKTRNNSAFRLPSREHRSESPNGQLCNRLHNQLTRLDAGKPLKPRIRKAEMAAAKERFQVGTRVQGPNLWGEWAHGVVIQTHKKSTVFVIRFDDGSFLQRNITKLLQDGFAESGEPLPEVERLLFNVSDRVISKRFKSAAPATVLEIADFTQAENHDVKIRFDDGKITTCDAAELTFYFEPGCHPYPELHLLQLERQLYESIENGQEGNEYLERQQETLLAKAQQFALAHGIKIDGSEGHWVFYPLEMGESSHPCPEFYLGGLARRFWANIEASADVREKLLDIIDRAVDQNSIVQEGTEDDWYFSHPERNFCLLPPSCSIALLTMGDETEEVVSASLDIGDRVAESRYTVLERFGTVVDIWDGLPLVQWTCGITEGFVTVAPPTACRLVFAFQKGDRVRYRGQLFQNSRTRSTERLIVAEVGVGHEIDSRPIRYKVQFLDCEERPFGALWYLEEDLELVEQKHKGETDGAKATRQRDTDRGHKQRGNSLDQSSGNRRHNARRVRIPKSENCTGGNGAANLSRPTVGDRVVLEPVRSVLESVQSVSESKLHECDDGLVGSGTVQLSLFGN